MRITGPKGKLHKALRVVEKVSGKNLTLPVLNCVLLSVRETALTLKATDLDLGVVTKVAVETEEEGDVAVSGNVLLSTLGSLGDNDKISLYTNKEGNLVVKTAAGTATIKAQSYEDFPSIPQPTGAKHFELPTSLLLEGFRSVWYSASVSSIKPELSSVYVYPYDKKIYFVATDSFRLAEKSLPVKGGVPEFDPLLIPFKNVGEIVRILDGVDGDVRISLTQNQISFTHKDIYITSRLVDGSFPDYQQILPKEFVTETVMLKHDFASILKKTTIFSDNFHQVRFKIDPDKKMFVVSSKNNDVGETFDNMHATLSGESLEISFNYKYLMDCLQSIHADSLTLAFAGLSRPVVIRGVGDSSFLYLVMPMNK